MLQVLSGLSIRFLTCFQVNVLEQMFLLDLILIAPTDTKKKEKSIQNVELLTKYGLLKSDVVLSTNFTHSGMEQLRPAL